MALDAAIHDVTVSEQTRLDTTGQSYPVTAYTYYVGVHGPFTYLCPDTTGTEQKFEAAANEKAGALRALGVLPQVAY